MKPSVTEQQHPQVLCADCGYPNQVLLPEQLDSFGPQLAALIACLIVNYRVPRRGVVAFLETLLGVPISLGSIQKLLEQGSQAVQSPYQEVEQQLIHEAVLNINETGCRLNDQNQWLWVLVRNALPFITSPHPVALRSSGSCWVPNSWASCAAIASAPTPNTIRG